MLEEIPAEEGTDNASPETPSRSPTTSPFDETQPNKATFPKADTIMAEYSTGSPTSSTVKRPKSRLSKGVPAQKDYGGHVKRLSLSSHDTIHMHDAYESIEPYKT